MDKFADRVKRLFIRPAGGIGIIFLLTFIAYSNIFRNQFILDDHDYIENWPLIRDWRNFPQFFWGYVPPAGQEGVFSPLKTLLHAVNYHLFGLNPSGYHVAGLFNYFVTVYFIYRISFYLIKEYRIAFITTLLFALHPVHAEYVASMTGSVDAAGITFLFVAFFFYIRSHGLSSGLNKKRYIVAVLFAFLAMFTHELTLSLPFLLLWYDFCFLREKSSRKGIAGRVMPFFIIGAVYILLKFLVLKSITRGHYLYDSFELTMLVIVKALMKYVYICFLPIVLTHNHVIADGIFSFDQDDFDRYAVLSQSWLDGQVLMALLLLGSIFYIAVRKWEQEPLVTFCLGWFFISLLPVLNIVPSGVYFAERYLFVGTFTFCLLLAYYINKLRRSNRLGLARISVFMIMALVVFDIVRIRTRNQELRDDVSLFESAVRANPQSALMHNDLGIVYAKHGKPQQALASFRQALAIRPDDPVIYFSMAQTYIQLDDKKKAADALEQAIILNPRYAEAHYNLAGLCIFAGQKDKGIEHFQKALSLSREQGNEQEARKWDKAFREFFRIPIPD
ncbi:MAG: tetratricopeptide repeat protein [Candidatus Omnitrophica bacterium]|nr:tetratricopeptide repeat protein [Candidatus Omnitrophota bacterium]